MRTPTNQQRRRYVTGLIGLWIGLLLSLADAGRAAAQITAPPAPDVPVAAPPTAPTDAPARVRYPDAGRLRDLQTDRDYQYGREAPPPDSALGRFWAWFMDRLFRLLSSRAYQNAGQYVLLAAIAGLAIYLLLKAEVLGFGFLKRAQMTPLDYQTDTEDIYAVDYGAALDDALRLGNYRLAVRLLYRQTLKHLADAGQIEYQPDKTNRQYVYELKNARLRNDFEHLTRQFEYVWYGNFPIDAGRFDALRGQFQAFNQPDAVVTH